jgi:methylthioribose-1-phosphate isomerase
MPQTPATIRWDGGLDGHLVLLDQTRLPTETVYLSCRTPEDVWHAIQRLAVRGAPAIGIATAYGVCLGLQPWLTSREHDHATSNDPAAACRHVEQVCDYLATSRPTAVNLFWALQRMRKVANRFPTPSHADTGTVATLAEQLLAEARAIHDEDRQQCAAIGRHGADLLANLPPGAGILTHCNTGALATGGEGTAAAVIYELARRGNRPRVWADETRPLLQGARLTMWELQHRGIDATLICDSAAAHVMREGRVQAVITGADRIAASGDTANKIGTLSVATLARAFGIPFYVAAPISTFDLAIANGAEIPIEQRPAEEITHGFGKQTAPNDVAVYNPAFDVTPAELIAAIITDRGIVQPVTEKNVRALANA